MRTKEKPATKRAAKREKLDPTDWPKVEYSDYGPVFIASGRFKGQFGYYDDDEELAEDEDNDKAIIYLLDEATREGRVDIDSRRFVIIAHKHLRKPPEDATPDWLRGYASFDDLIAHYQGQKAIH